MGYKIVYLVEPFMTVPSFPDDAWMFFEDPHPNHIGFQPGPQTTGFQACFHFGTSVF